MKKISKKEIQQSVEGAVNKVLSDLEVSAPSKKTKKKITKVSKKISGKIKSDLKKQAKKTSKIKKAEDSKDGKALKTEALSQKI